MSLLEIFTAIRADTSRLGKERILRENKTNDFLKEYLRVTYEPRINFYMRKVDKTMPLLEVDMHEDASFSPTLLNDIVQVLGSRALSGNRAKSWISSIHESLIDSDKILLEMLIGRDIKAGISTSTINKIWPGLITDVPYMRVSLPKSVDLASFSWTGGVFSQIKEDGMFANVSRDASGNVTISSRSGSPFPLEQLQGIKDDVLRIPGNGIQLHGELLITRMRVDGAETLTRQAGNGLLNKVLQGGELPDDCHAVFTCWDCIPLECAGAGGSYDSPYAHRLEFIQDCTKSLTSIQTIETVVVYSLEEAFTHYRHILSRGLEGTILKDRHMRWEDRTSKRAVKMKVEFECDLKITGFNEGNGKNSDLFGSISVETSDGKLKANVHGFSDSLRNELYEDRNNLIGKILTAKANCIMPPDNKEHYSLFLPIFQEIRYDKTEADSLERVQEQFESIVKSTGTSK